MVKSCNILLKSLLKLLLFAVIILKISVSNAEETHDNRPLNPEPRSIDLTNINKQDVQLMLERKDDNFVVSTSHNLATKSAYDVLKSGGSAVDAAIVAQLVLNVVEPYASGIGGGAFFMHFDAKTKKTVFFDARERAPARIKPTIFLDQAGNPREFFDVIGGGQSVGIPGVVKLLDKVHRKYGQKKWKDLFKPAINIANEGFPVDYRLSYIGNSDYARHVKNFESTKKIYFDADGNIKKEGELIKNPELAKTLSLIAKKRCKVFYKGKIAKNIINKVNNAEKNPGNLTLADFRKYKVKNSPVICSSYNDYKVCTASPPSSGLTILQALTMLEKFNLSQYKDDYKKVVALTAQALNLAYADRKKYIADPKFVTIPVAKLLDNNYLSKRSSLISSKGNIKNNLSEPGDISAIKIDEKGFLPFNSKKLFEFFKSHNDQKTPLNMLSATDGASYEPSSTTHISIIDKEGNAVSMTSSIEHLFGSGMTVGGFLLNNQLTDFSFNPTYEGKLVANSVAPYKTPRSSMSPTFIFDKNGDLSMIIGSPGGVNIISYILKSIIAVIDLDYSMFDAIKLPNFNMISNNILLVEKGTSLDKTHNIKYFNNLGLEVKTVELPSGINAISVKNGKIEAVADPRRTGSAMGE